MPLKFPLSRRGRAVPARAARRPRRQPAHPLETVVWRRARGVLSGSLIAWALHRLLGGESLAGVWVSAVVTLLAWMTAARLLLLDTALRRFWTGWLVASVLLVILLGTGTQAGLVLGVVMSTAFLVFRRYRPYRHLTSAQRANLFVLGLFALGFLTIGWHFPDPEGLSAAQIRGTHLTKHALAALRIYWVLTLLAIFVRMRLHHIRLKPKLAVSALFIALVPVVLVLVLAGLTLLGALGGSRAARGQAILQSWAEQVDRGMDLTPLPFERRVVAELGEEVRVVAGEPTAWLGELGRLWLAPPAEDPPAEREPGVHVSSNPDRRPVQVEVNERERVRPWAVRDTTAYFRIGREVWLLRLSETASGDVRVEGYDVDSTAMGYLARVLHCGVGLHGSRGGITLGYEAQPSGSAPDDTTRQRFSIRGLHRAAETDTSRARRFWYRDIRVGAALQEMIQPAEAAFYRDSMVLYITASLHDLAQEFTLEEYQFNQMLLIGFVVLAAFFLVMEALALYFGIRIATGITGAVAELHKGTVRLAAGELDTHIDVPNEDELGELAEAFNDMTGAVKRGREQAIERERLERELETARAIQQRLLPHAAPVVAGFDILGTSVSSLQVGGDYFDFLDQGDDRLGIAIGDVSGKGMPAALLMSNLQASLQGQVIHPSSVAEVVQRVNSLMVRSTDSQMFATFFYGELDRATGELTCTNAGHNPPILCRADGSIELLKRGGLLIGMLSGMQYEQETVALRPGDVLVLYTDGISEAEGPELEPAAAAAAARVASAAMGAGGGAGGDEGGGEEGDGELLEDASNMFGDERLVELVRRSARLSAAGIRDAILSAVSAHAAGVPQSDDITLVVIKRQI